MIFRPGFAVRSGITGRSGAKWCHTGAKYRPRPGSHIDAPQDRAEVQAPDDPDMHFSADTQARWVRNGLKSTPGYKMTSNGFACPGEESFIDKVYTGTLLVAVVDTTLWYVDRRSGHAADLAGCVDHRTRYDGGQCHRGGRRYAGPYAKGREHPDKAAISVVGQTK
ncbi:MAG: hypothetical protein GDA36_06935 [Rhodobacteraceae bacterium]|nr:hypothetical protein [Paracoccaceae bacterium]